MQFSATLTGIISPEPLRYSNYIAGCETNEEHWLELTLSLVAIFDEAFTPALLCRALRELDPLVLLGTAEEPDGTQRRDWPWLADNDLEALEVHCCRLLGNSPPNVELAELLKVLRLPFVLIGTPDKPLKKLGFFGNLPTIN